MSRVIPVKRTPGGPQGFRLKDADLVDDPAQDADMLDEQEQIALIEQMERAAGRQRHYSKALLAFLGLCLALLYCFFAAHQAARPWQTPHQARFRGHLRQHSLAAADVAGAATAVLAVLAAISYPGPQGRGSWRALLAASALLAVLQTVFWSVAILRVVEAERAPLAALWRLLWLPAVPPAFVVLIALAIQVMKSTDSGVEQLRRARYNYKRA